MEQLDLPLIQRQENNVLISQRAYDGYINATAMCKAASKEFKHYNSLSTTKAFVQELSSVVGIPTTELIQSIQGGVPTLQGTWVHPQVAINLGQWASPKFAVLVSKWVLEWMQGGEKKHSTLPWHIRRYLINREKIPPTHFSINL
ncbi:KilA-N domain-containing protein [Commensalibacter nepenthis]|uniref:KilA-N domain-containing protein n=1 Tax=Commensalibacter nepenthis TaxID=3043872 RepID=A0ABT6Q585_9PROT|nr:KilA-N domain-containing protein [Commensalibacter sp. TBRC 10068]MDI2112058.1 KilA-N domain-containing protein [Commensalibacter sp. TBRC 10068]